MSNITLAGKNFETVGQLTEALSKLNPDTPLNPFGSSSAVLFYSKTDDRAYLDEDYSWLNENDYEDLDSQISQDG